MTALAIMGILMINRKQLVETKPERCKLSDSQCSFKAAPNRRARHKWELAKTELYRVFVNTFMIHNYLKKQGRVFSDLEVPCPSVIQSP